MHAANRDVEVQEVADATYATQEQVIDTVNAAIVTIESVNPKWSDQ